MGAMRKRLVTSLLCLSATAYADMSDCSHWEWGARIGYREDQAKSTTFFPNFPNQRAFKDSFRNVRSPQLEAYTKAQVGWFEFGAHADYAWPSAGSGRITLYQQLPSENGEATFLPLPLPFTSCVRGDLWDAFGTAGFILPSYGQQGLSFFLVVQGGYSIHRQSLERKRVFPHSRSIEQDPLLLTFEMDFDKRFKRTYWGPFFGGSLRLSTCSFQGDFGYAFHWAQLKQTSGFTTNASLQSLDQGLVEVTMLDSRLTFRSNSSKGQRGWADLSYRTCCGWKVGLRGTYFQVDTPKKKRGDLKNLDTPIFVNGRWKTFSVLFQAGYIF